MPEALRGPLGGDGGTQQCVSGCQLIAGPGLLLADPRLTGSFAGPSEPAERGLRNEASGREDVERERESKSGPDIEPKRRLAWGGDRARLVT